MQAAESVPTACAEAETVQHHRNGLVPQQGGADDRAFGIGHLSTESAMIRPGA
jgi:hypothetical protein